MTYDWEVWRGDEPTQEVPWEGEGVVIMVLMLMEEESSRSSPSESPTILDMY